MNNAVLYLRFSSHAQNEASIEGQRKECLEYARRNNVAIIDEYIDRALSATSANRPEFLRMIDDSKKKHFQFILVYQLDRFARSREDSAHYKSKLKKNGVRVISAKENITTDASGILVEGVLESMAEYYSAELSQKIKRGIALKQERCLYTGGSLTLGYRLRKVPVGGKNSKGIPRCDNYIEIDPDTAPIVRKIFEMYAARQTIVSINEYLNAQQIKTIKKNKFNKNSLRNILQNRRYLGIFTYKSGETLDGEDIISEIPNGVPQIVSEELFNKVQKIMEKNREAPARGKAKVEYILTTKLFCGKCKNTMFGVSSTSKTKAIHNYYACSSQRQKQGCDKRPVRKQWIEDKAIEKCRAILTDENIEIIAATVEAACEKDNNAPNIQRLHKLLKENENAIENLFKALEAGQLAEQITKRISEKNIERSEIEAQLATEKKDTVTLTKPQVTHFLTLLQQGNPNDIKVRKALIALFVNKIYLYDEDDDKKTKITFILNIGEKLVEITEELLKDIESAAESAYIDSSTPPNQNNPNPVVTCEWFGFLIYFDKTIY